MSKKINTKSLTGGASLFAQPQSGIFFDDKGNKVEKEYYEGPGGTYYTYDNNYNAVPLVLFDKMSPEELEKWQTTAPNSPYRKGMKEVQNRQAMMRAAGLNVPNNGLWDDAQQAAWNKLTTKSKDYDTTLTGFGQAIYDKINGDTIYKNNPFIQDEVKTYNPDNVDWNKTNRSHNKVINAMSGTWGPIVAAAMAPYAVSEALAAPFATLAVGGGGALGGWAVDKASKALTGRDFATNVAMYTPLTSGMGEVLNPGYLAGGYGAERRMLDALYNQVTPIGYENRSIVNVIPKTQEMSLAIKDFLTPKRIKTSVDTTPAWKRRIVENVSSNDKGFLLADAFRDDAWRLAMRQKPRTINVDGQPHSLYIKNPDGTYSYDPNYINQKRHDVGLPKLKNEDLPIFSDKSSLHEGVNNVVAGDILTGNGGYVGVTVDLPKNWDIPTPSYLDYSVLNTKKPLRFQDKWDTQPFLNSDRSLAPAFTRWLIRHPNKFTNYLRNFDAVAGVGGNPFMLDMQVEPNVFNDIIIRK